MADVTDNSICPICRQGRFSRVFLQTCDLVSATPFSLLECDSCGVKKTSPFPEDLTLYYQNEMGGMMRQATSDLHLFLKNFLLRRELARIRRSFSPGEFLDIGCGTGDFARIIRASGARVSAADSCGQKPCLLETADIPYYSIDYNNYSLEGFPGMKDGLVVLRHVLEHIREPEVFVNRMIDYGANSFYIVLPDISSLASKLFGACNFFLDPPRHLWHFDMKSVEIFCRQLGLTVVDSGFDTIPLVIPSLYRHLRIRKSPQWLYRPFAPKGAIAAASLPLDWLLPRNVLWVLVRKHQG